MDKVGVAKNFWAVQVPHGAYGQFLLGKIMRVTSRPKPAAKYFQKCLKLNPMMWSAYEELCQLGAHLSALELVMAVADWCDRTAEYKQFSDKLCKHVVVCVQLSPLTSPGLFSRHNCSTCASCSAPQWVMQCTP